MACCSQRGLGERFDGSIGSSTVLFPYGGKYQSTPEAGMAAKIPVVSPMETSTVSLMAYGFDPRVGQWSPWHGAQISVLSSLTKIACMGGKPTDCRLSFQEFFGRAVNEKAWGYPAAALLGSIDAQNAMGTASIGGKDSMSGTFEELNVPHTLVSFAVTHDEVENVTSGSFKKAGSNVYIVTVPYSEELAPDFDAFTKNTNVLYNLNASGKIAAMYPVCAGGIAEAVTKMAMGNKVGVTISNVPYSATTAGFRKDGRYSVKDLFSNQKFTVTFLNDTDCTVDKIEYSYHFTKYLYSTKTGVLGFETVLEDKNNGEEKIFRIVQAKRIEKDSYFDENQYYKDNVYYSFLLKDDYTIVVFILGLTLLGFIGL